MSKLKIIIRYFIFITGLFFMGLGISLTTKSNMGTSPINSVPYVLSMIFHLTLGQFTFLLSILFLLTEIIILRKDFPKEQFLQVFVGPFFGLFVDLGMSIFRFVNPNIYIEKIIVLLCGCFALALGVYLQVIANVIINPGEGVVKVIANKTGKKFGNIKIMFDSTLCIIAIVISLFTFGKIKAVREGTIICAVLVGNITKIYSSIFEHFKYKKTKYETENYESSQSI
ncbi:hypothetical protein CLRAG_03730 [Clostridium ragsdalei P11]|uniref:YitT family protein n=1 Tax=Clostridium ragsdalei P11 TaxID=1353534 RepID=A0A1A6B2J5_9CLOT|nr:DUF6198 family protein [Clostridium ragsdalei]OBR96503.1 hypothetical protein CLRAG_03730 [Clostridium ragsdalei P11]